MLSKLLSSLFQDVARLTFIALRNEKVNGKLLTFAGPRAWTTQEVKKTINFVGSITSSYYSLYAFPTIVFMPLISSGLSYWTLDRLKSLQIFHPFKSFSSFNSNASSSFATSIGNVTASHSLSHRAKFAPTTTLTGRTISFLSIYGSCSF